MKKLFLFAALIFLLTKFDFAQKSSHYDWGEFSRADSLRGTLSPLRSCYDVTYYHLDIAIDTTNHTVQGSNIIRFKVVTPFNKMQVDLFPNMNVDKIEFENGEELKYSREAGAVFITLPKKLEKNKEHQIVFYYSGEPQTAQRPPWDGGFIWRKDNKDKTWLSVTCQGTGASLWWPNKDHQSDEPDSMLLSVTIPKGLEDVSNGRLRSVIEKPNNQVQYNWFISYPINNYNVTLNVGNYAHFNDAYTNKDGEELTLDYYVLPENLDKAKVQFKQAKKMLEAFEHYFGKYPFYRDGYKLIDSPHNGMEHQTAVAYGNHYWNGYVGRSSSAVGLKFDFIIVHESAHEWWGNNITSNDVADMWVHESFGAYAEALFVEYFWGHEAALDYINGKKQDIQNDKPIAGPFGVNHSGSGDMYNKGQLVLNTLRKVINNDDLWFGILKGMQQKFRWQTIDGSDLINFINKRTGTDYNYFFDQYLKYADIPEFRAIVTQKGKKTYLRYKWNADIDDFIMPVKATVSKDSYQFIYPTTDWQTMTLENLDPKDFKIAEDEFYCKVNIHRYYLDPRFDLIDFK